MKNSMSDLNQHLFNQLERLAADSLTPEQIDQEVKRADAIVSLADQVSRNADLQLKAAKLYAEHGQHVLPHLPQIGSTNKDAEK